MLVVALGAVKLVIEVNGVPRVTGLARQGEGLSSLPALLPQALSDFADRRGGASYGPETGFGRTNTRAVAVVQTVVEYVPLEMVYELMRRYAAWAGAAYRAMALHTLFLEKRARDLLTLPAEARYIEFLVDFPDLIGVLPQKDIAAYLGVTPVGMSRIASRVRR